MTPHRRTAFFHAHAQNPDYPQDSVEMPRTLRSTPKPPDAVEPAPILTWQARQQRDAERERTYKIAYAKGPAAVSRWHEGVQAEDALQRWRKHEYAAARAREAKAQRMREARANVTPEYAAASRAWNAQRMREYRARLKAERTH